MKLDNLRMLILDEADEMLVRITGENKGYKELLYEETGEIKYLGHVEVLVQLSGF